MICYDVWSFFHTKPDQGEVMGLEGKLSAEASKGVWSVFLSALGLLLDLTGDAAEVLTLLFVARSNAVDD